MDPSSESATAERTISWNRYAYVLSRPLIAVDPDRRDAVAIVFPDYNVDTGRGFKLPLGHAGVLIVDGKTGEGAYYEYGRYDPENRGLVQTNVAALPRLEMGSDGLPTEESMNAVLSVLSAEAGKKGKVEASYFKNDNDAAMRGHAEGRKAQNTNKDRKPYDTRANNCATFVHDTLKAGGVDTKKDFLPKDYSRNTQEVATRVYRNSPEQKEPKERK